MVVEILTASLIGWDKLRDLYCMYVCGTGGNMTRESVHADHNMYRIEMPRIRLAAKGFSDCCLEIGTDRGCGSAR